MQRLAVISVHGCPVIQAGRKDAGGMNIYVLETAKALSGLGLEVDVFTRHHDVLDPMVIHLTPKARVIHLPAGPPSIGKEGVYELLDEFTRQVTGFADDEGLCYDLIASHYWLSGLVGIELAAAWNVPHVTSFHTLAEVKKQARPEEEEHPARSRSERKVANAADRIVVWTEHECAALVAHYDAPPANVSVIPPGVDGQLFTPLRQECARKALDIPADEKAVLYVGRLERLKGLDILLQVMTRLDHPDGVRLYVAGGSPGTPEMCWLESTAAELGVRDKIEFLGSIPQEHLRLYYCAADVCVLPSYYESFGFAALEAAACGRPVVASRVGGLTTVVEDGRTGFLISWRCPGPFVERLDLLLRDANLREEMGLAARLHAQSLTWQAAAERLFLTYQQLIAPDGKWPAANKIPALNRVC
jgi:D-inositol-3-phosphate glycosyltransferase